MEFTLYKNIHVLILIIKIPSRECASGNEWEFKRAGYYLKSHNFYFTTYTQLCKVVAIFLSNKGANSTLKCNSISPGAKHGFRRSSRVLC
jgi:hypothetical protein